MTAGLARGRPLMRAAVAWLALVLGAIAPAGVAAHGDAHGEARPQGGGAVEAGGYRLELETHGGALAPGQETHVVLALSRAGSGAPVAGADVTLALVAPDGAEQSVHAHEVAQSGRYAGKVRPERPGPHRVRVAVTGLEGRPLRPPLAVSMPVAVEPAPGVGGWGIALVAAVLALGAAVVSAAVARSRVGAAAGGFNLLDVGWVRRVMTWPGFLPLLQAPMLAGSAVVVVLGFGDVQDGSVNLATRLTWTLWWAGVIFTFVLAGRVWCLACPFGALNEWTSRLAAPVRRLPRPLRNVWWATALFVLLTWADEQLGVVRSPWVTATLVLAFAAAAVAVGAFFERRSFCRHLCPIGGLIGIYSMTAPLELRAKASSVCRADADQGCYRGTAHARGCPMFEFPQAMDRNNYCTLCAECVKGCGHDNLALRFRALGKDLWAAGRRSMDEAYLAAMLVGLTVLVSASMLTAWSEWMIALADQLPGAVRSQLAPVTYVGAVESAVILLGALVVAPLLVLAACAAVRRLSGSDGMGVRRTFVVFAYVFVPVGLAMHLAHNLAHLLLEGGGVRAALQRAVALYTPWSLGDPDWQAMALASPVMVSLLQMAVLVGGLVLSLVAGHRLALRVYPDARAAARAMAPVAGLSVLFTVLGIVLLLQPMGMRHAM